MQPQIIIDYLHQQTNGRVNLTIQQAGKIIELVRGQLDAPGPVAKLSRYSALNDKWEYLYTVKTTQQQIDAAITYAINSAPVLNTYLWECYNAAGEPEGKIFTIHANLF